MSDLISREAAIKRMEGMAGCAYCDKDNYVKCRACSWNDAINIVEELQAVDAEPVEHGLWIRQQNSAYVFKCSACGFVFAGASIAKYCPNCGAKMDGGEANDTD